MTLYYRQVYAQRWRSPAASASRAKGESVSVTHVGGSKSGSHSIRKQKCMAHTRNATISSMEQQQCVRKCGLSVSHWSGPRELIFEWNAHNTEVGLVGVELIRRRQTLAIAVWCCRANEMDANYSDSNMCTLMYIRGAPLACLVFSIHMIESVTYYMRTILSRKVCRFHARTWTLFGRTR